MYFKMAYISSPVMQVRLRNSSWIKGSQRASMAKQGFCTWGGSQILLHQSNCYTTEEPGNVCGSMCSESNRIFLHKGYFQRNKKALIVIYKEHQTGNLNISFLLASAPRSQVCCFIGVKIKTIHDKILSSILNLKIWSTLIWIGAVKVEKEKFISSRCNLTH